MKLLIYISILMVPGICRADTFILKDGTKLEADVTGEMDDTLLLQTKYGALTIKKADIQLHTPEAAPSVSTQTAVEVSTAQPAAPLLTFQTVIPSTMTRQLVYLENGVAIATETFDASGALLSLDGAVKDGTYTEYYPEGGLKTVKTMRAGKNDGTLKAYYPSGKVQVEAYYLAGDKDGKFSYYSEDGNPLLESEYKGDKLNGWKREYAPGGIVASETYYTDDKPAAAPRTQAAAPAPEAAAQEEPGSMVTVKTSSLARGERYAFRLNNKFIGKMQLDKDFNLMRKEGKIPDGTIKAFSAGGELEKEFVFQNNELVLLRVYSGGAPTEYTYIKDKAVKK
ncbi:MAG: hypothetical protein M0011_07895 [Elusimicrobia bacterium]|nr:hypothetical protein [Elusimicrobiota bacterium]